MLKAVVATTLATAFLLLIILSQTIKPNFHKYNTRYGIIRRSGLSTAYLDFDRLAAQRQKIADLKERAARRAARNAEINKNYYEEGRLNISLSLMVLFPFLDRITGDGMIEYKELEAWIFQQAIDRLNYRTQREVELRDKDGDGAISFSEYLPQFSEADIERNSTSHGEAGWWMEQFRNADADRNGTLNLYEFRDFLHPEDSKNDRIHKWLLKEKIRQMDNNNDKQLDLGEFEVGAYDTYKSYVKFETGEDAQDPITIFSKLDVNKDRLLRAEELKPILHYLCPGELAYAKHHTRYLISQADDNKDGRLTLDEMLNHEFKFYNTVYDNGKHEDEDDNYHDEL